MTPGVGFFYGGLVDTKNVINQLFLSSLCLGIVTVQWVLIGYSLAFSEGVGIGTQNWYAMSSGLGPLYGFNASPDSPTYPQLVQCLFQATFAIGMFGYFALVLLLHLFVWSQVCMSHIFFISILINHIIFL